KVLTPYNYREPRTSALGFIYEGVTTYLGDKYLWTTKVYDDEEYAHELALKVLRHLHNPGRLSLSLADSSIDTWVDGYILGTPWRKVSIYNEGALVSMIIDAKIHALSGGDLGIEHWMKMLMRRCPLAKGGYEQDDLEATLLEVCGWDSVEFFRNYVYGTGDLIALVKNSLLELGWKLSLGENPKLHECKFGFKMDKKSLVVGIYPGSAAEELGLWLGDLVENVDENELIYVRKSNGERKVMHLPLGSKKCYPISKIVRD
ncbi:MAG: putative metalloprotease with PDZ domain, partial [Flavobacteriales bacterium]